MAIKLERRVLIAERISHRLDMGFDVVRERLHSLLPKAVFADICALAEQADDEAAFIRLIEGRLMGPSGLMLYVEIDHGAWTRGIGSQLRAVRMMLGNPAITAMLMREDVISGLFSPVELLLAEAADGRGARITYMQPSTLMALDPDAPFLRAAAEGLDEKLAWLVHTIAGRPR